MQRINQHESQKEDTIACSGWEKTALKNPSLVCAAGVRSDPSTGPRFDQVSLKDKDRFTLFQRFKLKKAR